MFIQGAAAIAAGGLCVCLFQIITFCFLGTVLELSVCIWGWSYQIVLYSLILQNIEINTALVSLEWYLLAMNEQRIYNFLLVHSNKFKAINIGGIIPLNMETCLSVSQNTLLNSKSIIIKKLWIFQVLKSVHKFGLMFATIMWICNLNNIASL